MTPHRLAKSYRRFEGACCLHLQGMRIGTLRHGSKCLPNRHGIIFRKTWKRQNHCDSLKPCYRIKKPIYCFFTLQSCKKVPLGRRGQLSLTLLQSCYRNWVSFSLKPRADRFKTNLTSLIHRAPKYFNVSSSPASNFILKVIKLQFWF